MKSIMAKHSTNAHRVALHRSEPISGGLIGLYEMPGHLIRRLQQVAYAIFMEETADLDVTPVQFAALSAIYALPGIDATRVSGLIAFDRSTLGDVLERIEGKGWVERRPSTVDKRVKLLWLTDAGNALYEAARPAVLRAQHRMIEPLPEVERDAFTAMVKRLVGFHNGDSRYA